MVVLGGVTRLTGSGLSMADWRPVTGVLPPMTEAAWQQTFELYQQTPEFKLKNSHMDVQAFKSIFWLEYLHRLLGRLIGLAFFAPLVWFLVRGRIPWSQSPRYFLMLLLGGFQGLLGWYMVKSGLVDNPAVSQYRLTAHLMSAFLIFGFMLWTALSLLHPPAQRQRHAAVPALGRPDSAHHRDNRFGWLRCRTQGRQAVQHVSDDGRLLDPTGYPRSGTGLAKPVRQSRHRAIRSSRARHHDIPADRGLLVWHSQP